MNSIKEKMENFHNGKDRLDKFLQQEREKNRYDPRPDLGKDNKLWEEVLKTAERVNKQIYSNLHGFRCAGARLKVKDGKLKLFPTIGLGYYWKNKADYRKDRKEYLMPYEKEILLIFN